MFERFTDDARRVVVLAQEQSRRLNHDHIGTEHLLLGLLEAESVAAKAMESLDISAEQLREEVEDAVGRGQAPSPSQIPFTPRAKKVLELSLREALQLGHNYIGTEHILLGVIREGEGVAAKALTKLTGDLGALRKRAIELAGRAEPSARRGRRPSLELEGAVRRAEREAAERGQKPTLDHLLLGLLADDNRFTARLRDSGVDVDALRRGIDAALREREEQPQPERPPEIS